MRISNTPPKAVIIGAGFCGLTAAYALAKKGWRVRVLEQEKEVGGLAGSFAVNGIRLEKFYHHWFTNDQYITALVEELDARDEIVLRPSRTGLYYANSFFKLSSPLDLLKFRPLKPFDRLRLATLAIRARQIRDWKHLETLTAKEWLRQLGGQNVYKVVWEPLLRGKFGKYAEDISAVWFWNKLKLRGGSRGRGGAENLAYYRGGFAALADRIAESIRSLGGEILTNTSAEELIASKGTIAGVRARGQVFSAEAVIATPALPVIADLFEPLLPHSYVSSLRRINYLANVCLVLELERSLSDTYWLNVNDPSFPFVGVIEHTNFEPPSTYGNVHIVYLSKYLPEEEHLYRMDSAELLEYTLPHLRRMFPQFQRAWIKAVHVWRARYSQPVVERNYSRLIPPYTTPMRGLYIASMAQVYPEDRGTNYAVREGMKVADVAANGFVPMQGEHQMLTPASA